MRTSSREWISGAQQDDVPSRAEAMRRLVELGLMRSVNDTVRFSDGEKLLAIMMRDLYKHLKLKGEIDPDFVGGSHLGRALLGAQMGNAGSLPRSRGRSARRALCGRCSRHVDIPRTRIRETLQKDKERVEKEADPFGKYVRFAGFDGNNETSHEHSALPH